MQSTVWVGSYVGSAAVVHRNDNTGRRRCCCSWTRHTAVATTSWRRRRRRRLNGLVTCDPRQSAPDRWRLVTPCRRAANFVVTVNRLQRLTHHTQAWADSLHTFINALPIKTRFKRFLVLSVIYFIKKPLKGQCDLK